MAQSKTKSFTDTFVFRLGDQAGAWASAALRALGDNVATVAMVAMPGQMSFWGWSPVLASNSGLFPLHLTAGRAVIARFKTL